MIRAAVGIVAIILSTGCRLGSNEADARAIDELQERVDSAIVAGDTERYLTFLTADAVLMPPNEPPVRGKDAIRSWSDAMAQRARIQEYRPSDQTVVVAGDWAFREGSFQMIVIPAGSAAPIRSQGKFIIIYRRGEDGTWRIARDIWNLSGSP